MFDSFTVIPAIDLKGGEVVRLMRGDMNRATVYSSDPAAAAKAFEAAGAKQIHVVDLDGAIAGEPRNLGSVRAIRQATRCSLDVSGGLRTMAAIRRIFEAGADQIALGSAAFLDPALLHEACLEYPGRVLGSLDAQDGRMAIKGWVEKSGLSVDQAAARFREAGAAALIYTDIARDGTQTGVDERKAAALARKAGLSVVASGGVASLDDILKLRRHFGDGVVGTIIGRALYEGKIDLARAIAETRGN